MSFKIPSRQISDCLWLQVAWKSADGLCPMSQFTAQKSLNIHLFAGILSHILLWPNVKINVEILSFHILDYVVLWVSLSVPFLSEHWVIPDLLIGFTADLEHLLALELQLFSQSADILVERVDLAVQLSDVALPPGYFLLQLSDATQQLTLLERGLKKTQMIYFCSWSFFLLPVLSLPFFVI